MLIKSSATNETFTKIKIDRHLRDINDTISEEDINNVTATRIPDNRVVINNGIIEIVDPKENNEPEVEKTASPWHIL